MPLEIVWCCVVACLWGITNALLKEGASGVDKVQCEGKIKQILYEIRYLVLNWRYTVPFLINQAGSLLYFWTLSTANLSVAVPLTNSLTLVIATLVGKVLGEKTGGPSLYIGIILILTGVTISAS